MCFSTSWTTKARRKYLAGQTNFDAALPDTIKAQALAVKDHYVFDLSKAGRRAFRA